MNEADRNRTDQLVPAERADGVEILVGPVPVEMGVAVGVLLAAILVGMQVPSEDKAAFDAFLATLGYPYVEETLNPAYRLFLRSK